MNLEQMPLNPEKALGWSKGAQSLLACCEKATRDPGLTGGGCCGGAGYRCLRCVHTTLWNEFIFFFALFLIAFGLWVSLAAFISPEKVLPWYAFMFTILLFFKTQVKGFQCLHNLRMQADELTSKMRFASEGVDAIFNDEGQCLEFWVDCGTDINHRHCERVVFEAKSLSCPVELYPTRMFAPQHSLTPNLSIGLQAAKKRCIGRWWTTSANCCSSRGSA